MKLWKKKIIVYINYFYSYLKEEPRFTSTDFRDLRDLLVGVNKNTDSIFTEVCSDNGSDGQDNDIEFRVIGKNLGFGFHAGNAQKLWP